MEKLGIGIIVGNRGFFPDHLCKSGRETFIKILEKKGCEVFTLSEKDSKFGSVETWQDAQKCAELFKKNKDKISGIIVTLPNFGDERGIADTLKYSELNVPVLIHAWPDDIKKMDLANRRDSFCGKISACNNLNQYGIKFSLTTFHTEDPESQIFQHDLDKFFSICRIKQSLKNLKLGAIGTRPDAFKTVRYSEKILERYGISINVIDLSEIFLKMDKIPDNDTSVKNKIEEISSYLNKKPLNITEGLIKMTKLYIVIENWLKENGLQGFSFQCWLAIEEKLGIVPCSVMSYFSHKLIPAACEVDVTGLIGMYVLQKASLKPSAIVDWNNNFGDEKNKAVIFHCSNFPLDILENPSMEYQAILSGTIGKEKSLGAVEGKIKKGPFSFLRVSTDDTSGKITGYVGKGKITEDKLNTFGGIGVVEIENLQDLLHFICSNGFEHHVAINLSETADAIYEALQHYLNWDIFLHV